MPGAKPGSIPGGSCLRTIVLALSVVVAVTYLAAVLCG